MQQQAVLTAFPGRLERRARIVLRRVAMAMGWTDWAIDAALLVIAIAALASIRSVHRHRAGDHPSRKSSDRR